MIPILVLHKSAICSDSDEARKARTFRSVRLASPMVALQQFPPSVFPGYKTGLIKIDGESTLAEPRRQLPEDWFVLRLLNKHPHYSLVTHHVHLKLIQGLDNLFQVLRLHIAHVEIYTFLAQGFSDLVSCLGWQQRGEFHA